MSKEDLYVLRSKNYTKGDRYSFFEDLTDFCTFTGKSLDCSEIEYEKLKYAEIFESLGAALTIKDKVDPKDELLNVVHLRTAEEEY